MMTVALIVRTLYHVVLPSSVCDDFFCYHYSTIYLGFRSTMTRWNTWKASLIICHLTFLLSKTTRLVFLFLVFFSFFGYLMIEKITDWFLVV